MVEIAICDDIPEICLQVEKLLVAYREKKAATEFGITMFSFGKDLVDTDKFL